MTRDLSMRARDRAPAIPAMMSSLLCEFLLLWHSTGFSSIPARICPSKSFRESATTLGRASDSTALRLCPDLMASISAFLGSGCDRGGWGEG